MIGTEVSIPFSIKSQFPEIDSRKYNNGVPWASKEEVLATILTISRAHYLEVNILGDWYYFEADLVTLTKKGTNESVQILSGLTPAWDIKNGIHATLTLSGNTTITLSNLVAGQSGNLTVTNPAAVYTLTFSGYTNKISPAVFLAANQVKITGLSKIDVFSWWYDGSYLIINGTNNY